ncbi:cytochrome P450 [Kutzneria sp. CA-103260]|uniref:cytochrome P450 n=1 Tax=Kutzneria sp. CA-103260 TaxID=2802641 RepID=UPI001BA4D930|nr:cytochrome P450 [Kutzneria sp. CA-103260]QUQ71560.1 cytochrome P450 [Kutzneria sp. CA-103260]
MTTTAKPTLQDFLDFIEGHRKQGQVVYSEKQQTWLVLGHPEVNEVLSEPHVFGSDMSELVPLQEEMALFQKGNFISMDDPRHRQLRGMVSQAFTPKFVAGMEPAIHDLTVELLDAAGNDFDLVDALAYPLPVIVIANLLGIPTSDQPVFRRWADTLLDRDVPQDKPLDEIRAEALAAVTPVMREMNEYFRDFIKDRRRNPGDDLTSKLTLVEEEGKRLDDEEIIGFVGLLLLAGHITTTATLGNSILTFHENQDAIAEVRRDLSLLPAAIEEVLRLRTPFPRVARVTKQETRLGGVTIPEKQFVLPFLTAANRDARVFPNPNQFDLHRDPNHHATFGKGIHFCLGAPLARLEARVALKIMLERYADIQVDEEKVEERNPFAMVAVTKLPLVVRPV